MIKNTKAKGTRNEHKSMKLLESMGYRVTRSGASLGAFDLIGIGSTNIVLVQCKSNAWPGEMEMEAMRYFPCPKNCTKLVHRWRDGERHPDVKEV